MKLTRRVKVLYGAVTVVLFFVVLECALALAGVKPLFLTRDPFVGFQPGVPLFVRDGDMMRTNPSKVSYFNEQAFRVNKSARGFRIFCLGGSTTFGHPYDYRTSFSNWLAERLRDADPQREWEVINCGGISYASYRECLLMQELVQYQPDLFVVATGHNEFLEERTYGPVRNWSWAVGLLSATVTRTRIGTVLASALRTGSGRSASPPTLLRAEVDTILEHAVGPSDYTRDEELREQVVTHFRHSLDRMCAIARAAGARVILVQPAANVRNFTPFKSEHGALSAADRERWEFAILEARRHREEQRPAEAVAHFLAAAQLDPHYAQGLWEAADALWTVGRYDDARAYFQQAVDEDVCPLRATTAIQQAVQEAARANGVTRIDFPRILEEAMPSPPAARVLGDESFLDHVHPTIEGHRLLAWALFDQLVAWKVAPPQESTPELVARVSQNVLAGIDQRVHALALVQVIQVLSWAGKNEEALRLTDTAERTCPGLSEVAGYRGRLLEKLGREDEAIACYREAIKRNVRDGLALSRLGFAMLRKNDAEAARTYFATAILSTPPWAPASVWANLHMGMGVAFARLEQWPEARFEFQTVLNIDPSRTDAGEYLRRVEKELARSQIAATPR